MGKKQDAAREKALLHPRRKLLLLSHRYEILSLGRTEPQKKTKEIILGWLTKYSYKSHRLGAREMAQPSRALTSAEDPGSVPSTDMIAQNLLLFQFRGT